MKDIVRNILAVLAGCLIGMMVNMSLIISGNQLLPLPEGVNPMNAMAWESKSFIFPFLAQAIGTLAGAFITAKFSSSHHMVFAVSIGVFFLAGGISMVFIIPAPVWFISSDLLLAYLPMAWCGWKLSGK
jgi:uncharacterized membrane protein YqgA involved in biofilm formation